MRRQKLFRTSTLKFRQSFRELTQTYADASEWDEKAKDLAGRFIKNFAKYESNEAGKALVSAGPQL